MKTAALLLAGAVWAQGQDKLTRGLINTNFPPPLPPPSAGVRVSNVAIVITTNTPRLDPRFFLPETLIQAGQLRRVPVYRRAEPPRRTAR